MFVTHQQFKAPLSALMAEAGEQLWDGVALVFQNQWVMLSIRHIHVDSDGDEVRYHKTMFLTNFSSILSKNIKVKEGDKFEFVSGYIFMHINEDDPKSFDWSMEAVAKVWTAESDDDPGATFEVCETKSGKRHIITRFVNQDIKIKNLKLIIDFT